MKSKILGIFFLLANYLIFSQVNKDIKPEWVKPSTYNSNFNIEDSSIENGKYILLLEQQLNENKKEYYHRNIIKITENTGVQSGSEINVMYDPSYQTLTFHSIKLTRNNTVLDKLQKTDFQLIRKELNSESYIYDGTISATANLSDVRVGDIIEYSYSIQGTNPIYQGNFFASFILNSVEPIDKLNIKIITDKKLNFKSFNTNKKFKRDIVGKTNFYSLEKKQIPAFEFVVDAPSWEFQYEVIYVSNFYSWKQVVDWGIQTFSVNKSLSSNLKAKIAEIEKSNNSAGEKIEATLNFIQDDIRYLGLENGIGAYQPFSSNKVFEQRYGDCKDKSLLMTTMLNEMGIEAYPMLVNTYFKETIVDIIPSPIVFNHCVVKVIDKEEGEFWYDPTIPNQGGDYSTNAFPSYGVGLVLKKNNKEFDVPYSPSFNSNLEIIDDFFLEEAGKGAIYKSKSIYYDNEADVMRNYFKNNSIASINKEYENFYSNYFYNIRSTKNVTYKDKIDENIFTVFEEYKIDSIWQDGIAGQNITASFYPFSIINNLSMPAKRERKLSYFLNFPLMRSHTINLYLPQQWNINDEDFSINSPYLYYNFDMSFFQYQNKLQLNYILKTKKNKVPASQFSSFYDDIKKIDSKIAYNLYIPKNGSAVKSNNNLSVSSSKVKSNLLPIFGIFLTLIVLGISIFTSIKLYKFDPEPKIESYFKENKKIGGWLILLAVFLCLAPLISLLNILFINTTIIDGSWILFLDNTSTNYNPKLGIFSFIKVFINLLFFCLSILSIILFFKKRSSFPKLYSYILISFFVFSLLDTFILSNIGFLTYENFGVLTILWNFIKTSIISMYLLSADEVKETFVKRFKS